jgi:hypothetical protein
VRDDLVWFIGRCFQLPAVVFTSKVLSRSRHGGDMGDSRRRSACFGTFSRTYFDRTERKNRARLLWGSLLFFAVGPLLVWAGAGFAFFVAALWAYYHLVKQHYGFMVLTRKRTVTLVKVDNALDRLFLLFAFNYPFVKFIARDPEAMARVPRL